MYSIKEIYYTIQGEGLHSGKAAIFCRFSGCNLWSGLEKDRSTAVCKFCDTNFWGTDGSNGGKYSAEELAKFCKSLWPENSTSEPFIVCTGGEPLLQMDDQLITQLKDQGFYIAIETNGTIDAPSGIDWICVSPKANAKLKITEGQELKLVYPQVENTPEDYQHLEFEHFSLQPLDDPNQDKNTILCINYVKENPHWSLSLQTHKYLGID